LSLRPVLGEDGGDLVPIALSRGRLLDETVPPGWLAELDRLAAEIPAGPWGERRHPLFITSSNFGVGSLYAFRRTLDPRFLPYGTPYQIVESLRARFHWGPDVTVLSHACVSAHVGLTLAARALQRGLADRALVFSFDFISPFVTGGFHALKILNSEMPAPYADRPAGSIGLGDGAAFVVLDRGAGPFVLAEQALHNEMHHFTANRPDGEGFAACLAPIARAADGRRLWVKGHGTGTLEAGRLEAEAVARLFPGAPLVSWKGGFGHTLGSCGLVELAVALAAVRTGRTPGTVGSAPPCFSSAVAVESFANREFDAVLLASNAFGGAHAACLLCHD
ncbi:MAG: beta-ketoacyl synthase N-terminal-like domain-containing protein, partial [Opitutaceae bacterium]